MRKDAMRCLAAAMMIGLFVTAGCTPAAPERDGPPTYPVTGTVTMSGAPLAGATVRFELLDGSKASTGQTDDQGKYSLSTFSAADGALAGDYRVTVVKMEGEGGGQAVSEDDPNYTGEEADIEMKNVLPEKYASVETSELTATVVDGDNNFDFSLE